MCGNQIRKGIDNHPHGDTTLEKSDGFLLDDIVRDDRLLLAMRSASKEGC